MVCRTFPKMDKNRSRRMLVPERLGLLVLFLFASVLK